MEMKIGGKTFEIVVTPTFSSGRVMFFRRLHRDKNSKFVIIYTKVTGISYLYLIL
jgi:hypothetical protein